MEQLFKVNQPNVSLPVPVNRLLPVYKQPDILLYHRPTYLPAHDTCPSAINLRTLPNPHNVHRRNPFSSFPHLSKQPTSVPSAPSSAPPPGNLGRKRQDLGCSDWHDRQFLLQASDLAHRAFSTVPAPGGENPRTRVWERDIREEVGRAGESGVGNGLFGEYGQDREGEDGGRGWAEGAVHTVRCHE